MTERGDSIQRMPQSRLLRKRLAPFDDALDGSDCNQDRRASAPELLRDSQPARPWKRLRVFTNPKHAQAFDARSHRDNVQLSRPMRQSLIVNHSPPSLLHSLCATGPHPSAAEGDEVLNFSLGDLHALKDMISSSASSFGEQGERVASREVAEKLFFWQGDSMDTDCNMNSRPRRATHVRTVSFDPSTAELRPSSLDRTLIMACAACGERRLAVGEFCGVCLPRTGHRRSVSDPSAAPRRHRGRSDQIKLVDILKI